MKLKIIPHVMKSFVVSPLFSLSFFFFSKNLITIRALQAGRLSISKCQSANILRRYLVGYGSIKKFPVESNGRADEQN